MLSQKRKGINTDYLFIWWQLKKIILIGSIGVAVSGFLAMTMLHRFQNLGQQPKTSSIIYIKTESHIDCIKNN